MLLTKNIYNSVTAIKDAIDGHDYESALGLIKELEEQYEGGLGAFVNWQKGVALDYLNESFDALNCFKRAIELDPSCYYYRDSLNTCLNRIKVSLNGVVNRESFLNEDVKNIENDMRSIGFLTVDIALELLKNYLSRIDLDNFDRLFADLYQFNANHPDLKELGDLRITHSKKYLVS